MLDVELIKLISQRIGILGFNNYSKLMLHQSNDYRGGTTKQKDVTIVALIKEYATHSDNFLSLTIDTSKFFIGFSIIADNQADIVNVHMVQYFNDQYIKLNTVSKLNVTLFIEQLGNLYEPIEFSPTEDESLILFKEYYESIFPDET